MGIGIGMEQDRELIERINGGDAEAFEALYRRYREWVYRLAWRFTGRQDLAMDVVQETFIYLLKKFPGFELTAKMTTFLYPAVRSLSRDARRKEARFIGTEEEIFSKIPASPPDDTDRSREDLAAVLSILPVEQREVILMRFLDGMSLEEIAAALGIPIGTVKSRLHHALAVLREDERMRRYFFE